VDLILTFGFLTFNLVFPSGDIISVIWSPTTTRCDDSLEATGDRFIGEHLEIISKSITDSALLISSGSIVSKCVIFLDFLLNYGSLSSESICFSDLTSSNFILFRK
jgi:hypothetical protein